MSVSIVSEICTGFLEGKAPAGTLRLTFISERSIVPPLISISLAAVTTYRDPEHDELTNNSENIRKDKIRKSTMCLYVIGYVAAYFSTIIMKMISTIYITTGELMGGGGSFAPPSRLLKPNQLF